MLLLLRLWHDAAAAGFDDELLYRKLAGEPDATQLLADEAREVFTAWKQHDKRISY